MTREDIIKMARQSGFADGIAEFIGLSAFDKFAQLVAAAEREACAKVAQHTVCDTHIPTGVKIYGTAAAKAIRARGQQ